MEFQKRKNSGLDVAKFNKWCDRKIEIEGAHEIDMVSEKPGQRQVGIEMLAATVPGHYASTERIAAALKSLGKAKAAKWLEVKLPTSKNLRSGDLGEIIASNYIKEYSSYSHSVNRLRWKDHRQMAMRGDDLIAVRINNKTNRLEFLKGEVKSRVSLTAKVLGEARATLKGDHNRPSPHALQ